MQIFKNAARHHGLSDLFPSSSSSKPLHSIKSASYQSNPNLVRSKPQFEDFSRNISPTQPLVFREDIPPERTRPLSLTNGVRKQSNWTNYRQETFDCIFSDKWWSSVTIPIPNKGRQWARSMNSHWCNQLLFFSHIDFSSIVKGIRGKVNVQLFSLWNSHFVLD